MTRVHAGGPPLRAALAWARARPSLCVVYAGLVVLAAWINPFRSAWDDDDFAYGRMVQQLLRTGRYLPDKWATAQLPFQTYYGALFSLPFGYSPGALRISTLALFAVALGCFYQLLRDHGTPEREAGLLTGAFLASPMALHLAFGFMTDLHYLSWIVVALFCYARGLTRERWRLVALGSMAGFAAVGTRQIGVTLVCGLVAAWLFDGSRKRRAGLYLLALALPAVGLFWQYYLSRTALSWAQGMRYAEQARFLANEKALVDEIWWRPTAMLQYVSWYLLPIFPVFLVHHAEAVTRRGRPVRPLLLCLAAALFWHGSFVVGERRGLMPSLAWIIGATVTDEQQRQRLHYATAVFSVLTIWLVLRRYVPARAHPGSTVTDKLIGFVAGATLCANTLFVQLGDRYIVVFVPFVLWFVGRTAGRWSRWTRVAVLAGTVYMAVFGARRTRNRLDCASAMFSLGDLARARGVNPREVAVDPPQEVIIGWVWQGYYGAYDDWAESLRGRAEVNLFDFWGWLGQRNAKARYAITVNQPGPDAAVLGDRTWRDIDLKVRHLWLVDRRPREPHR